MIATNDIDALIAQAQEALPLESKVTKQDVKQILETVLKLKATNSDFEKNFESIEQAVNGAMGLDFSNRKNLKLSDGNWNVIDYATQSVDMLIEKMETDMVSKKAFDMLVQELPNRLIFITDSRGVIRYANQYCVMFYDVPRDHMLKINLANMIHGHAEAMRKFSEQGYLKDEPVEIVFGFHAEYLLKVELTMPRVIQDHTEMEEFIYILNPLKVVEANFTNDNLPNVPEEAMVDVPPAVRKAIRLLFDTYTPEELRNTTVDVMHKLIQNKVELTDDEMMWFYHLENFLRIEG